MVKDLKDERLFTYEPSNGLRDAVNVRLLRELQGDPRLTMTELGRRVGMSSPAVTERVRRLEEAGVIRGYRLDLDPAALGLPWPPTCASAPTQGGCLRSPTWRGASPKSWSATASPARTASSSRSTSRPWTNSTVSSTASCCTVPRPRRSSSPHPSRRASRPYPRRDHQRETQGAPRAGGTGRAARRAPERGCAPSAMVMVGAAGLLLKAHGRDQTLKGLARDQHGYCPTSGRRMSRLGRPFKVRLLP